MEYKNGRYKINGHLGHIIDEHTMKSKTIEENLQAQATIKCKRFSRTKYPYHEKGGESKGVIKVICKGNEFARCQHFCCSDCNTALKLEPLEIANCSVNKNIKGKELNYSVVFF
jgi:hypothetical protein